MTNVLHIISTGSGHFGGIEAYLMNFYKNMDHDQIHFDFAFCGTNTMKLYMGAEVFQQSSFFEFNALKQENNNFSNWKTLINKIRELGGNGRYDIVEVHSSSPMIQAFSGIALKNIDVIKISHSHALQEPTDRILVKLISTICRRIISKRYDYFLSCSYVAGRVYGDRVIKSDRFKVIYNAIDLKQFSFNQKTRLAIRNIYKLSPDTFVVGHVARLSEEKNQLMLIDIFNEILKIRENAILWIVGEGPYREEIKNRIKMYGIEDKVILFGQRRDVSELLQAMDVFIITSLREGLCISAIESQAAGLPTFVSDGVPEECKMTDVIHRLSLNMLPEKWASIIVDSSYEKTDRNISFEQDDFNIKKTGKKLEKFYCTLLL